MSRSVGRSDVSSAVSHEFFGGGTTSTSTPLAARIEGSVEASRMKVLNSPPDFSVPVSCSWSMRTLATLPLLTSFSIALYGITFVCEDF